DHAGFIRLIAALSPGEVADYTASYTQVDCGPNPSTVTVTGDSICGSGVHTSGAVTGSCPVNCEPSRATALLDPHGDGANVLFSFQTETGLNYTVEFSPTLAPADWQFLTNLPGTGGLVTIQEPCTETQRFYRVLTQ